VPLSLLIELCRSLRHYLAAGLTAVDAFRRLARKGPARLRPLAGRVLTALEGGDELGDALAREGDVLPPLLLGLVRAGEAAGMLPEVCDELERYFVRRQKLWHQFLGRITWPVIQFVLAVLVLAGLILVLGLIGRPGEPAFDPLGLGLAGPGGALLFLGVVTGVLLGLGGAWWLLRRGLRRRAQVDAFLLRLWALGPCLRSLAVGRFCLALRLTTATGMPIATALDLSLEATGNAAFAAASPRVRSAIRGGSDLTAALTATRLFPEEFGHVLAVAEESGRLDDVLRRQAEHYDDEAGRRLATLATLAAWGVWALVAVALIVVIFRLFGSYLGLLDRAGGLSFF
jgi:type IV pilus assembly protein PilC